MAETDHLVVEVRFVSGSGKVISYSSDKVSILQGGFAQDLSRVGGGPRGGSSNIASELVRLAYIGHLYENRRNSSE